MHLLKNLISFLNQLLVKIFVCLIKVYGFSISPFIGRNCRFYPSCSEYAKESVEKRGIISGLYLTVLRLLKCHPWHPGGIDPVPPKQCRNNKSHPQTEF